MDYLQMDFGAATLWEVVIASKIIITGVSISRKYIYISGCP